MELNFRSNTKVYISLSIMLHTALFGAAAFLNINNYIAEETGKYSDLNRRIIISSVFRESPVPAEKAGSVSGETVPVPGSKRLIKTEAGSAGADNAALKAGLAALSEELTERPAADEKSGRDKQASEKAAEALTEEKKSRSSEKDEASAQDGAVNSRAAEKEGSVNSAASDPETLSISSFTTDLSPVYPEYARKNSYEGVVRVSLTVNRKGRGENIRIVKSSGYSVLDKAAVKAVKKAFFKAKNSRVYYLSAALNKALLVDINFSLTESVNKSSKG